MSDWQHFVTLLCLLGTGALSLHAGKAGHQRVYHGLIREDAKANDVVTLDKPLYMRNMTGMVGDRICGYTLYVSKSRLPFEVVIKDPKQGHAEVVLAPGYSLSYDRRHRYTFELAGHDCDKGHQSAREKVHIEVEQVKAASTVTVAAAAAAAAAAAITAAPIQHQQVVQISEPDHIAEVVEGQLFESIVQLRAHGHACNFHLASPGVPFIVNSKGVLRNTEPLDYNHKHNYIIEVTVDTCQPGSDSKPEKLIVNIKVLPTCSSGWKGIASSIDYVPESNTKLIAENAKLELCSGTCKNPEIDAHIKLTTKHIGKGCDRDTYSIQSQRKLCGASTGSVDLLPNAVASKPHGVSKLSKDDGKESDQIYSFDGKTNVVEVPTTTFNHTLSTHFTISLWMKHSPSGQEAQKKHGKKEQILCNSDSEKMSRHHYSLFVHNCKLIFLLRQEPLEGTDMNVFKPAEWRWKLADVCDSQWHHYAVSIDFPQVRLYVDGKLHSQHNGEQTIDDWPLHKTSDINFTRLVIGACWAGRTKKLNQFFHGYLAGVNILKGKTESDRVIRCLNNCKEKLDFHGMSQMTTGMSVEFNSEMTEITLKGHNQTSLEALFNRVGYVNARVFPTPGYRALTIKTEVKCPGGQKVTVADVNTRVLVLAREKPVITISGDAHASSSELQLARGQDIFHSISVVSRTRQEAKEADSKDTKAKKMASKMFGAKTSKEQVTVSKTQSDKYSLDSCSVTATTALAKDERFSLPTNLLHQLGLDHTPIADGVMITGVEKVANYERVLQEIHYSHSQPQNINTRSFVVVCSELNGRFISNSFKVQLDVLHPSHQRVHVPQVQVDTQRANVVQQVQAKATVKHFSAVKSHNSTAVGTVVIVVICIGFLLAVIGIGVMRIRATQNQGREAGMDEKQEMEWDNSALTITVNPMEDQGAYDDSQDTCLKCDDSDTDDDDSVCYHDDAESSEEEEAVKVKRDLEWDDSTLSF